MDAGTVAMVLIAAATGAIAGYTAASLRVRRISATLSALLGGASRYRDIAKARQKMASRPRRRYIVFEVVPGGVSEGELREAIVSTTRRIAGETGLALSGLALILYNEETSRGVIRVRHTHKNLALAVLGLTRHVSGKRVLLVPLASTGSLKRAKRLLS